MYIAETQLQDFKSYSKETKLGFDISITAFVRPNWCAKNKIICIILEEKTLELTIA